jgi:hypothetical protein
MQKVRTSQNICKSKVGVDARLKVEHLRICKSVERKETFAKEARWRKEKRQERKCNKPKKSELHCENLQTKGKNCKTSKAKEL